MTEYEVMSTRPPTPDEERLAEWLAKQELRSPDQLDSAGREILGLTTGLLGLLLGVVAVSKKPIPSYLSSAVVRWLAVAGIVLLLLTLIASLAVLWPRRRAVSSHSIADQQRTFQDMLQWKSRTLSVAFILFLLGLVALGAVLVLAILTAS